MLIYFQSDWLHRYEACGEYAKKLAGGDFMQFVDGITFVEDALDQVMVNNDCYHAQSGKINML